MREAELTIRQTPTGYWSIQRGETHLTGAMTRKGAEAECEMLKRLGNRRSRPVARRYPNPVRTQL